MLRSEAKPGDVFRYVDLTFERELFYVPRRPDEHGDRRWRGEICHANGNPGPYQSYTITLEGQLPVEERLIPAPSDAAPATSLINPTNPDHYLALTPEPIDVIESWELGFRLANVVKYVARHGKKQGADALEDLKKARRYLSREIAALEGRKAWE